MKSMFNKSIITYVIGIFILVAAVGGIISLVVTNYIALISTLLIMYIVLILIMLQIFHKYIKPIEKTSRIVTELVEGNFRARIHHPANGSIGLLSGQINKLARNLSELSVRGQMKAEQLSTVINNTDNALALIDDKGYIHIVNRKFLSMLGKTSKDYIGHLYYEVISDQKIQETIQEAFLYEKSIKHSFTKKIELSNHYYEVIGAPIFDERNMAKGIVLALYDVTEIKRLEIMRKDFIANISHELKMPIKSIRDSADVLMQNIGHGLEEQNKENMENILVSSTRSKVLIDDLLTISRLEQEDFQLDFETVSMDSILEEILPQLKEKAKLVHVQLSIEVEEALKIIADRNKIKEMIINLLSNAINYTTESGTVSVLMNQRDNHVLIEVKDTGIGISEQALPRIFERFYRVDEERSRVRGGTGLGLSIVKHIVEVHHGEVKVESELQKGTTFTVFLPLDSSKKIA
ncbi:MAG TPA: ATP-binding protein [Virgibacillus sp.]|nr:ATP-binding protein [Virgibacillus sp.]